MLWARTLLLDGGTSTTEPSAPSRTASVIEHARAKLARKGCDLLVVNDVSAGKVFGSDDNEAVLLGADGTVTQVPLGSKSALSHSIWDAVVQRLD